MKLFDSLLEEGLIGYLDVSFADNFSFQNPSQKAVLAYLMCIFRKGHLCLEKEKTSISPSPLTLWPNHPHLSQPFTELLLDGFSNLTTAICADVSKNAYPLRPICRYENKLYLQKNWVFENRIAKSLRNLFSSNPMDLCDEKIFHQQITNLLEKGSISEEQANVLRTCFSKSISFICGGPGTGKTYTASLLLQLFFSSVKEKDVRIVACAPTGKAVAQLQSSLKSLPITTQTLHAFLGLREGVQKRFGKCSSNADIILVDEASMIDAFLMAHLLDKVRLGSRVIFMGDPDQLPPVEAGSVFTDLIDICDSSVCKLTKNMRFERKELHSFAEAIRLGKVDQVFSLLENGTHVRNLNVSLGKEFYSLIEPHFLRPSKKVLDPKKLCDQLNDFRILSCLREGSLGVNLLNHSIRDWLFRDVIYGDNWTIPIMITTNHYGLDLYNGMIGVLVGKWGHSLSKAYFLDPQKNLLEFPSYSLPTYEYAYVLSVHKSQGSEFNHVVFILSEGSEVFGREIFYTAATRAKKQLDVIGDKETMEKALNKVSQKITGLKMQLATSG